jgi:protein TonB
LTAPRLARLRPGALLATAAALALGGCSLFAPQPPAGPAENSTPPEATAPVVVSEGGRITPQTPAVKAYRKLGAQHIYKKYPKRIYKGKIPPLVYAVVVVETELDAQGNVMRVGFSRTPSHAPEVPPLIAQLIRDASPLPAPAGSVGAHTYVETWLWDKSGRFQLDSLTQGQRSR